MIQDGRGPVNETEVRWLAILLRDGAKVLLVGGHSGLATTRSFLMRESPGYIVQVYMVSIPNTMATSFIIHCVSTTELSKSDD